MLKCFYRNTLEENFEVISETEIGGEHMPLIILGIFFGLGIIVYYIITTTLSDLLSDDKPKRNNYEFNGNVINLTGDWEKEKEKWMERNRKEDDRRNG